MQRKRLFRSILALVMMVILWSAGRAVRQSMLNHALIAAARAEDPSQVAALLRQGADPNAQEPLAPLTLRQRLRALLTRRSHIGVSTSPLAQAVRNTHGTVYLYGSIVKVMPNGMLHFSHPPSLSNSQIAIARLLLEHGADPNIKLPESAMLPGHWWFEEQDEKLLTLFFEHGADPNRVDADGNSALMYAVNMHQAALVRAALKHGGRPDQANRHGDNALMWAVLDHDVETIKLLLAAHADVNSKNQDGFTALTYAVANGAMSERARASSDSSLAARERQTTIDLLLAAGADVNAPDRQNCTPFLHALNTCGTDDGDISSLLRHRADMRLSIPRSASTQTVSWEILGGSAATISQTTPGTTPLMFAVRSQTAGMVRRMLAMGADVHARDKQGKTALTYVKERGRYDPAAAQILTALHGAGARN